jgi:peptide chain release factor 1
MRRFQQLSRQYKELQEVVETYERYKKVVDNYDQAYHVLNTEKDADLKQMAREEMETLEAEKICLKNR